jgi:hypothetical protein
MSDNFQKTVDLKKKITASSANNNEARRAPQATQKKAPIKKTFSKSRAEDIDQVYGNDPDYTEADNNFKTISRPVRKANGNDFYKKTTAVLFAVLLMFSVFYFVRASGGDSSVEQTPGASASGWYAVKLVNNEVYYGEITDTGADPLVIKNVYYNYDQVNPEAVKTEEGGSLRLVKRGKETHGPDGSMNVIRTQVLFLEPLKADSKVLKAILDYEK